MTFTQLMTIKKLDVSDFLALWQEHLAFWMSPAREQAALQAPTLERAEMIRATVNDTVAHLTQQINMLEQFGTLTV